MILIDPESGNKILHADRREILFLALHLVAINIYSWRNRVSFSLLLIVRIGRRDSNELNIIRYDSLLFFNERLAAAPWLKTFSDFNRRKIFPINWTATIDLLRKIFSPDFFFLLWFVSRMVLQVSVRRFFGEPSLSNGKRILSACVLLCEERL